MDESADRKMMSRRKAMGAIAGGFVAGALGGVELQKQVQTTDKGNVDSFEPSQIEGEFVSEKVFMEKGVGDKLDALKKRIQFDRETGAVTLDGQVLTEQALHEGLEKVAVTSPDSSAISFNFQYSGSGEMLTIRRDFVSGDFTVEGGGWDESLPNEGA